MGRFLKFLGNIQGFAWYPGLALGVFGLFFWRLFFMLLLCAVQIQMPGVGFLWIPESGTSILVLFVIPVEEK